MADVTNPGLTDIAIETYGNPDPNGGVAEWKPRELDVLTDIAQDGHPLAPGQQAVTFSTPVEVDVDGVPHLWPSASEYVPPAINRYPDEQVIGQGTWVDVDPLNPSAGKKFVTPADFIVVGSAESFQTNSTDADLAVLVVGTVLDADALPTPAGPNTTRFMLVLLSPVLTTYPVSLQGRQVIFADDTLTTADQGATRQITGYGTNYIVIERTDLYVDNGNVQTLDIPQAGDVLYLDVSREGSEVVSTQDSEIDVTVYQAPFPFSHELGLSAPFMGNINITTGPQPGEPIIGSGEPAPTAINVDVADQSAIIGLPRNVFA